MYMISYRHAFKWYFGYFRLSYGNENFLVLVFWSLSGSVRLLVSGFVSLKAGVQKFYSGMHCESFKQVNNIYYKTSGCDFRTSFRSH